MNDIIVIGGGAAGLSMAAVAAQLGKKVLLIEEHKMGGECLNYGCVPSKALLHAARKQYEEPFKYVKSAIDKIKPHDSIERFNGLGVEIVTGHATFVGPRAIEVDGKCFRSKKIVIATGATAAIPDISGLKEIAYRTNETIFSFEKTPKSMVILGGGPIGVEMAQAFSMLGTKVFLFIRSKLLPKSDEEAVNIIRKDLQEYGVEIFEGLLPKHFQKTGSGIDILVDEKKYFVDEVLVATGRAPRVSKLGLDKANVVFDHKGILVNSSLRTTNPHVYASGDCISHPQFTHVASYEAGILIKKLCFSLPAKASYAFVPRVTYTNFEIAELGEIELQKGDRLMRFDWQENDRSVVEKSKGFTKVRLSKKGMILGVVIVGKNAGEFLAPWCIAFSNKLSIKAFAKTIFAYPTQSEMCRQIASEYYKPKLFSAFTRRLVKLLS